MNLEVIPLKNLRERCFLILFEDAEKAQRSVPSELPQPAEPPRQGSDRGSAASKESRRLAELEFELTETRDYLQSIQERHEAADEELQASNEEIQSADEECRALTRNWKPQRKSLRRPTKS